MATKITSKKPKNTGQKDSKRFGSKFKYILSRMIVWFFGLSVFLVVIFKFLPVPFTPLMVIRVVENAIDGKEIYFSHDWESLKDISNNLQKLKPDFLEMQIQLYFVDCTQLQNYHFG